MSDRTPPVVLKPIEESDLDFWEGLLSQPLVREHQPLRIRTAEELLEELGRYSETDLSHPIHRAHKWVVIDVKTGERTGVISFDKLDLEHNIGRIGYTISEEFWGRGYATAAVHEAIQKIFSESNTERIEADCSVKNEASSRVLEKNGFGLEGIKRGYLTIGVERVDHFSYGLLRSDWCRG
ncbi:MAG: GNAT family N-acetyltransferase [Candidatus Neomarinimicrobiota bacterium]